MGRIKVGAWYKFDGDVYQVTAELLGGTYQLVNWRQHKMCLVTPQELWHNGGVCDFSNVISLSPHIRERRKGHFKQFDQIVSEAFMQMPRPKKAWKKRPDHPTEQGPSS